MSTVEIIFLGFWKETALKQNKIMDTVEYTSVIASKTFYKWVYNNKFNYVTPNGIIWGLLF